jgi:hypothetical protein
MKSFLADRGLSLAVIVAIMFVISLLQGGISYTISFGELRGLLPIDLAWLITTMVYGRFALSAAMAVLWILKHKRALVRLILIVDGFFTLALLSHTSALIGVLLGGAAEAVRALLIDVMLMATSNILIFSIWYWVIDQPELGDESRAGEPWQFLFPQRGGSIPHYESWFPQYWDYLFVAFTTSFAFSPTDVLPLTRRAKMLMMLQAAISVITLTGIAGSAINILAGR